MLQDAQGLGVQRFEGLEGVMMMMSVRMCVRICLYRFVCVCVCVCECVCENVCARICVCVCKSSFFAIPSGADSHPPDAAFLSAEPTAPYPISLPSSPL